MSSKFSMILVLLFMFSVTAVSAQSPASISVHKQVKPVFKGEVHNPVLKFEVMTSQNDVEAGQFDLQIGESTARLIDAIEIYYTGSEQSFSAQQLAGGGFLPFFSDCAIACALALAFFSQMRAQANSMPRMARPAGMTMKAGPGNTMRQMPTTRTVPPTMPMAIRFATLYGT